MDWRNMRPVPLGLAHSGLLNGLKASLLTRVHLEPAEMARSFQLSNDAVICG